MAGYNCSPVSGGCDQTFASQRAFDLHLRKHPRTEQNPDCKDAASLLAEGFVLSDSGLWTEPLSPSFPNGSEKAK